MTPVENLAVALAELEKHAKDMQSTGTDFHSGCPFCEMTILLARLSNFGLQARAVQLQELR